MTMRPRLLLALFAMAAVPAAATDVIRLAPETRDAVLAAAAAGPERAAVLTPEQASRQSVLDRSLYPEFFADGGAQPRDRRVHGEVSVFAGSGGMVGMAGTAIVPVGDSGMASISILQSRGGFASPWFGGLGGPGLVPGVAGGGFGRPGNLWANGFSLGYASGPAARRPR
jgi:hypothetical protein